MPMDPRIGSTQNFQRANVLPYSHEKKHDSPNEVVHQRPRSEFLHAPGLTRRTPYSDGSNYGPHVFTGAPPQRPDGQSYARVVHDYLADMAIEDAVDQAGPITSSFAFAENINRAFKSNGTRDAIANATRAIGNLANAYGIPFASFTGDVVGGVIDLSHLRRAKQVLISLKPVLAEQDMSPQIQAYIADAHRAFHAAFERAGLHQE